MMSRPRPIFLCWGVAVMAFLLAPLLIAIANSLGRNEVASFPPEGFSLAAYGDISQRWWEAIGTSLLVSAIATAVAATLGTAAAYGLVRGRFAASALIEALVCSPLQVPALVTGVAFLLLYAAMRRWLGFDPRDGILGLVIAHSCYCVPFVFLVVLPELQRFDRQIEEAAFGLGASRWTTFRSVLLPVVMPAVIAGSLLAFFMSFDNLPLSLFLLAAGVKMFPVELFAGIQFEVTRTVYAVATVVALGSTFVVLLGYRFLVPHVATRRG